MIEGQFYPGQPLQFQSMQPFRNPWHQYRMIDVIQRQGLTSNLRLCLDAADGNSLPAASTKWLDTSGNGYDFFRGTTAGAEATDPTINGSQDGRSSGNYLSFDGGDYLTYDTTNETWMQNIHKDSFVGTILAWYYNGAAATSQTIFGNGNGNAGNIGFRFGITSANALIFQALDGSGAAAMAYSSAATITASVWNMLAISITEASALGTGMINGTLESFTSTYTTPSAASATYTTRIGQAGNGAQTVPNLSRIGMLAAWEGTALTDAQLTAIFTATRGRFGV